MVVVNAFLVDASEREKEANPDINYFGYVLGNVSFGETKEHVINELEKALKILVDHSREHLSALSDRASTDNFINGMDRVITMANDYNPFAIKDVKGYGITMHVYDLGKTDLRRTRDKKEPIEKVDYVKIN